MITILEFTQPELALVSEALDRFAESVEEDPEMLTEAQHAALESGSAKVIRARNGSHRSQS